MSNSKFYSEQNNNQHKNHRARMRSRLICGLSRPEVNDFSDHELLELLLFYAISRRDTNGLAHNLIDRFGDITGILDASIEELTAVEGIGESCALLIKLAAVLFNRYSVEKSKSEVSAKFDDEAIQRYLVAKFSGFTEESVYLLFFDDNQRLIGEKRMFDGSFNYCPASITGLAKEIFNRSAPHFVLAHNHPQGIETPSESDMILTYRLKIMFEGSGINFKEHYIVTNRKSIPILRESVLFALRKTKRFDDAD